MAKAADLGTCDGDELWSQLCAATWGTQSDVAATIATRCMSGGSARLGWIHPPEWGAIETAMSSMQSWLLPMRERGGLVLATGGWSFALQALTEMTRAAGLTQRLSVLDNLAPTAISAAVDSCDQAAVYLAISGSGSTVETRMLVESIMSYAKCDRTRLLWLRDFASPPGTFALSPLGVPDQIAMLGAPLSMAFLAPAATIYQSALALAYQNLHRRYLSIGADIARQVANITLTLVQHVEIVLPEWAANGLRQWMLQLGRQVLCGKSPEFRPWVDVVQAPRRRDGGTDVVFDLSHFPTGIANLMELMYSAGLFIGILSLRAGLQVAEHQHVDAYKTLLQDDALDDRSLRLATVSDLPAMAADWLHDRSEVARLHVVFYGSSAADPDTLLERLKAATGLVCELHTGSAWNHHSFQAVYDNRKVATLLVVTPCQPSGRRLLPSTAAAARTLRRIAVATHKALGSRSAIVELSRTVDEKVV